MPLPLNTVEEERRLAEVAKLCSSTWFVGVAFFHVQMFMFYFIFDHA